MEPFVRVRKGKTPRRLHPTPYYIARDQGDKLRQAVDIVTDRLARHEFASGR